MTRVSGLPSLTFILHPWYSFMVDQYAEGALRPLADRCACLTFDAISAVRSFEPGVYVLAGDNRLDPTTRAKIAEIWKLLEGRPGFVLINDPLRTLGRYELLTELQRRGLNDFRIFGAWEDLSGIRFPAFVRHRFKDGGVPRLLHSRWQVDAVIGRALLEGSSLDQLVVVEFRDTACEAGVYEKYSAFRVGDRILPVSVDSGSLWVMRNHAAAFTQEGLERERRYVETNPHSDQLEEIFDVAGISYGRIDYSVDAERVLTWEINTLPTIEDWTDDSPVPDELRPFQAEIERRGYGLLAEAWQEVLAKVETDAASVPNPAWLPAEQEDRARPSRPPTYPSSPRFAFLRRLFSPVKRLLNPLLNRTVLPIYARVARSRTAG